jgi:hypothetical protein
MAKVQLRNELLFKAPTRVGLLAEVTEALAAANVDIIAIGAYDKGDAGEFLMVTSDKKAAGEALAALGGTMDMAPVVVVEIDNVRGALAKIARRIAGAGINISQVHATTTDTRTAAIVLRTDREAEVVDLLSDL